MSSLLITGSQTFTLTSTSVQCYPIGGGGGGGGGNRTSGGSGGGGGGSAAFTYNGAIGDVLTITIGAGGVAGTSGNGNTGGDGGDTTVKNPSLTIIGSGKGGKGGVNSGSGGAGGTGTGTTTYTGGNGGNTIPAADGAGGGSAADGSIAANGNNGSNNAPGASGGVSPGGNAGAGAPAGNGGPATIAGGNYGGGGGGGDAGASTNSGTAGGPGACLLVWTPASTGRGQGPGWFPCCCGGPPPAPTICRLVVGHDAVQVPQTTPPDPLANWYNLSAFDYNGNFIWRQSIGNLDVNIQQAPVLGKMQFDKFGNIYVPWAFNRGGGGVQDQFQGMTKLNFSGQIIWETTVVEMPHGAALASVVGPASAFDSHGNIWMTVLDVRQGADSTILVCLDTNGQVLASLNASFGSNGWPAGGTSPSALSPYMAIDASDNIYYLNATWGDSPGSGPYLCKIDSFTGALLAYRIDTIVTDGAFGPAKGWGPYWDQPIGRFSVDNSHHFLLIPCSPRWNQPPPDDWSFGGTVTPPLPLGEVVMCAALNLSDLSTQWRTSLDDLGPSVNFPPPPLGTNTENQAPRTDFYGQINPQDGDLSANDFFFQFALGCGVTNRFSSQSGIFYTPAGQFVQLDTLNGGVRMQMEPDPNVGAQNNQPAVNAGILCTADKNTGEIFGGMALQIPYFGPCSPGNEVGKRHVVGNIGVSLGTDQWTCGFPGSVWDVWCDPVLPDQNGLLSTTALHSMRAGCFTYYVQDRYHPGCCNFDPTALPNLHLTMPFAGCTQPCLLYCGQTIVMEPGCEIFATPIQWCGEYTWTLASGATIGVSFVLACVGGEWLFEMQGVCLPAADGTGGCPYGGGGALRFVIFSMAVQCSPFTLVIQGEVIDEISVSCTNNPVTIIVTD